VADGLAMTLVAGVDEAGRGPLAGPVVAAAVVLDRQRPIEGVADSKRLTAARRQELAAAIRAHALAWAIGQADAVEIDALGILRATLLAMRRAIAGLALRPALVLVDGNRAPRCDDLWSGIRLHTIIRGDATEAAIGAASILAKTMRDSLLEQMDTSYPGYGFAEHKGYPTAAHRRHLARLGASAVHRVSFSPVESGLATR
jgi:ribonuclease HII